MATDDPLIKSHRQNQLWPSVHAAVDVYYRRRLARGGSYELIWRLIHVWESSAITLAAAGAAWLRQEDRGSEAFRGARERLYGVARDDAGLVVKTGQGALDGSIDKWIEILNNFTKLPAREPTTFFGRLQAFLNPLPESEPPSHIDIDGLVRSWERACDVPSQIKPGKVTALEAMRAVNSLRNRFAHVPFPFDRVDELRRQLEDVTVQLFAVRPGAATPDSVLAGSFVFAGSRSFGGAFEAMDADSGSAPRYAFNVRKGKPTDSWDAAPFVTCDEMMRSYVLTRLKNADGIWEYTRYLAESNAVIERNAPELLELVPRPVQQEYQAPPPATGTGGTSGAPVSPAATMDDALAAIHEREFARAIAFLAAHLRAHPQYHVGWSRLGYAQRELAVDVARQGDRAQALKLLDEAIESFSKATEHRDAYYQADALYQRSKTRWRRWMVNRENLDARTEMAGALADARAATAKSDESRFVTWLEFLEDFDARGPGGGDAPQPVAE